MLAILSLSQVRNLHFSTEFFLVWHLKTISSLFFFLSIRPKCSPLEIRPNYKTTTAIK